MGEPIVPVPCDPVCCLAETEVMAFGPNIYSWPMDTCGTEESQWAWWAVYGYNYVALSSSGEPGCLPFCIYTPEAIVRCENDYFSVHMWVRFRCRGQASKFEETFGAYKVMCEQGLGPLPDLLYEQHRDGDDEWLGIRDGKKIVKILFKRDISSE